MVENGLYQLLRDDDGVSALIAGRIFASSLPKVPKLPAVVYQVVVTTDDDYSFEGANRFRRKRFQFDSYAEKYDDARQLSDTVRDVLKSFSGTLSDEDSTLVNGCKVAGEMDLPEEPGSGTFVHRRTLEVDVWHTEAS